MIGNGTTHSLFSFWLAWHKKEVTVLLNKSSANPIADVSIFSLSIILIHIPTRDDQRGTYQRLFLPKGQKEQNNVEHAGSDQFNGQ